MYAAFFPLDQSRILGDVSKQYLDSMIRTLLEREPVSKGNGLWSYDVRARNALEEIQALLGKIQAGENCGVDRTTCFTMLSESIARGKSKFPDVFLPVEHAVQSWMQLDAGVQENGYSWVSIFRTYHNQLLR